MKNSNNLFKQLEDKIHYNFKNRKYLINALTHSSFANEENIESNERLEYLGDSILEFVMSDYLYKKYPNFQEGDLTKLRSMLVCKESLSEVATKKLNLPEYLLLGKSQIGLNGKENKSFLEDATEALIAAIYLDSGLKSAADFILFLLEDKIEVSAQNLGKKDYKTTLQEYLQSKKEFHSISYNLVRETGPAHDRTFVYNLTINGKVISNASGRTKKAAETECARLALKKLGG